MNDMKLITTIAIVALIVAGGIFIYFKYFNTIKIEDNDIEIAPEFVIDESQIIPPPVEEPEEVVEKETVLGTSVENRAITAYHYGEGEKEILFVGGIHGGYSWNTALLAYELMDYLEQNPNTIPEGVRVSIIPVLNPDGLTKIVGTAERFSLASIPQVQADTVAGRFNANTVDLNRNFDCDWQTKGTWQDKAVSGGNAPFSEPESLAFKKYIESSKPTAVIVWYSSLGGVFASNCHNGILPETSALTTLYADASGYQAYENFDFYEITGDVVNWLAKNNIPAISVLLTTHDDTEWNKNLSGIEAVLNHYAE
ncbi:TPA: hypothetical protein DEP58_00385 [Patescibacteria group bacterium]|nr:hypothetical protein [Patescibacteria group bacterium]